jgi:hypothetical protein
MADSTLHHAVYTLLCDFQRAFDLHDWTQLEACLDERVYTDYSSFRGTAPEEVSRERYVALRREALSSLRMQHNFSNLRVSSDADTENVTGECNYAIYRFAQTDPVGPDDFFHSFGRYVFRFRSGPSGLRISAITQQLTASYGNPDLHRGVSGTGRG